MIEEVKKESQRKAERQNEMGLCERETRRTRGSLQISEGETTA